MNAPKRSAPGREIAGAAKLRLAEGYRSPIPAQACFSAWKRHGEWLLAHCTDTHVRREIGKCTAYTLKVLLHGSQIALTTTGASDDARRNCCC